MPGCAAHGWWWTHGVSAASAGAVTHSSPESILPSWLALCFEFCGRCSVQQLLSVRMSQQGSGSLWLCVSVGLHESCNLTAQQEQDFLP